MLARNGKLGSLDASIHPCCQMPSETFVCQTNRAATGTRQLPKPSLVASQKFYTSITPMFGHMHDILNVDEKIDFHILLVNCKMNLMRLISP